MPCPGKSKVHRIPRTLGKAIESITGKIPLGADKHSHNLNHSASERARNTAIQTPKNISPKGVKKRNIFEMT